MAIELITPLPPGAQSFTKLAKQGARLVVLRELKDGTDCAYPLGSPGLVTLQEVVEFQGKRQALFPWVPGVTLREVLQALELVGQSVPVGLVARVLIDAARALQSAQPPRAHGGLQDGSLQLGFDGAVSVLDFGAPRVTRFRAPGRVNFSADVFSLGGVLHAALTGFEGDYAARAGSLPAPSSSHPGVTEAVDAVVLRALSTEPDSRQSSAGAFADALTAAVGDELFSNERVGEVVRTLFKERVRLLDELTAPDEEEVPLGDGSLERTQPRIAAPPLSKKEIVPWSEPDLPAVQNVPDDGKTRPNVVPPLGDDAESHTQPRVSLPPELLESARDAGPVPAEAGAPARVTGSRASVTPPARMTGQRAALVPRRSTGEHVLASSSLGVEQPPIDAASSGPIPSSDGASPRKTGAPRGTGPRDAVGGPVPPRGTGQRDALSIDASSSAARGTGQRDGVGGPVPPRGTGQRDALIADGETSPRASAPRGTGQRDAVGVDVATTALRGTGQRDALIADSETSPRASAPRGTGQRDAVGVDVATTAPRGTGQRDAVGGPVPPRGTGQRDALIADSETSPRASAPRGTGQRDAVGGPVPPRGTGQRDALNADGETSPRASAPRGTGQRDALGGPVPPRGTGQRDALIADSETSPRASAPRGTGQRDAVGGPVPPRGTGQRDALIADSEPSPRASAPRGTGSRDALSLDAATAAPRGSGERDALIGEADTNPRASAPRGTGSRGALIADADTSPRASAPVRETEALGASTSDGETNPRASAPVRSTGQRDALIGEADTNPRASAPRMTGQRAAIVPRRSTGETPLDEPSAHDATNPRASAPPLDDNEPTGLRAIPTAPTTDEEPDPTNPRAVVPNRNTTTFERLQARGQERIETPPEGTPAVTDSQDDILEAPTAVRERPRPPSSQETAQTAQTLKPATSNNSVGLSIMILVLLVVVVGIGVAVFKKVEQANAPEPLPEPELPVDAGVTSEEEDGGDSLEVLPVFRTPDAAVEEPDASVEEDEGDAGEEDEEEVDAGTTDAGVIDAGGAEPTPVKKTVPKKKKRRRR